MIYLKLGKVVGNVVASVKDPGLVGLRLLVVQGLNDDFEPIGKPYVAADGIYTAGPGDIVYLVSKKEAALAISKGLVPIDECIVGFVEEYNVIKPREKKRPVKTPTPPKAPPKMKAPPKKKPSPMRPHPTRTRPKQATTKQRQRKS